MRGKRFRRRREDSDRGEETGSNGVGTKGGDESGCNLGDGF